MIDTTFETEQIRNEPHEIAAAVRVVEAHEATDLLDMLGID